MKSYFLTELKYQLKQLWMKWARPVGQVAVALLISIGTVVFSATPVGQRLELWLLRNYFEFRRSLSQHSISYNAAGAMGGALTLTREYGGELSLPCPPFTPAFSVLLNPKSTTINW